ncbi:hypothetical protein BMS3Abin17_00191 [archaeon BMS3Abin17]|nr:hypothetical protein BMS3Abin17_00191 [archaeon BMS3Abin17]HDZ61296.1 hypothetical protein [Candidatus Pacearchaeota archaeon]
MLSQIKKDEIICYISKDFLNNFLTKEQRTSLLEESTFKKSVNYEDLPEKIQIKYAQESRRYSEVVLRGLNNFSDEDIKPEDEKMFIVPKQEGMGKILLEEYLKNKGIIVKKLEYL